MAVRGQTNQNSLNLFLNSYFNIITVFIVIIVFVLVYFLLIQPKYDETMSLIQSNLEQQQKLFNDQKTKLNNLKIISDLYSKIPASDLKKFNGVLPDDYVKEKLFGELDEIITNNGYILNSIDISKSDGAATSPVVGSGAVQRAKIGAVNVRLSLSAVNYLGFKNLLKLLENNLRLFDITDLSFSPGGNSVGLTLSTYYYKK